MSARIVVGYTATKSGKDAVTTAARLAAATGAALDIAIVLPAEGRSVITPPDASYDRYLQGQALQWLAEASALVPDTVDRAEHVRYADSFAEGLGEIADELHAAALVVGAADGGHRGRHRLGSTATTLLHSADVPVVLVPRGARKVPVDTGITRLTAAVGTRPGADVLLEEAASLATSSGAPLRLLSLVTVDLPTSVDTGVIRLAGAAHADSVLTDVRAELPAGLDAEVVAARGESIEAAVGELEWDAGEFVLVGSSRLAQPRRLFLGSTAAKMLHVLPVPLIVVPRTRAGQEGAAS